MKHENEGNYSGECRWKILKPEIKKRIEQIRKGEAPEGYKKTKVGIVPGEWDVKQLKHILDQVQRKVPKPKDGYWRLGLRSHAKGTFHEFIDDPNSIAMEELFSVAKNDLIVNITFAWEHAIALANRDDEGKLVSHRFPTYVFNEKACPYFYKYYVIQPHFKKMLSDISPGGAGRNRVMSKSSFIKLFAVLPPLPEQEKIAEVLSTWDKAIELKEQLIAEKKQQKKWLMQNLLTGKIRSPGFTDEWQEVQLGNLGKLARGKGVSRSNIVETGFPLISYGEIYTTHNIVIREYQTFINSKGREECFRIYKGDIIFTGSGESANEIGKAVAFLFDDEAYAGGDTIVLTQTTNDSQFLAYMLNSDHVVKQLASLGQGNSVVHIYPFQLDKIRFLLPPPPEQAAIADILSTADREIDLHEKQLEELKKQKKALMQLLLTGIVRVYTQEFAMRSKAAPSVERKCEDP
ncbi:MAG: restriction endonuclease subunit S [Bacillota bacterium]